MNKTLEIINLIYKPYKIEKKNKCLILYTMDSNICLKESTLDYLELYNYLISRNFEYIPKPIDTGRKDTIIVKYEEDIKMNASQKANDLIKLVSLLHSKTVFFKEINSDKYKEIKSKIKNRVNYIKQFYNLKYESCIKKELYTPSEYLFLRNYSLINNACNYCLIKTEEWYSSIDSKLKERICLIHNNLKLDHYIKNKKEYLISWDQYAFDNPIIDLYKFYQNEWSNISFKELLKEYNQKFNLTKEETTLLYILISIPYEVKEKNEMAKCRGYRRLINYLNKSADIIT